MLCETCVRGSIWSKPAGMETLRVDDQHGKWMALCLFVCLFYLFISNYLINKFTF